MNKITRREFLKKALLFGVGAGLGTFGLGKLSKSKLFASGVPFKHEARFYKNIDEKTVQCKLCPRGCTLQDGQRSFCRVREPKDGKLYALNYGLVTASHVDPIEKKPLFHFLPGSAIYSIATAGCNFRCKYCQNWSISQFPPEEVFNEEMTPSDVVNNALKDKCPSIAYTYTEPAIFYEYMFDTAIIARSRGIKNMYHSNGSLNKEPVKELCAYLDAADIDLKSFSQDFYDDVCAGYLETVLDTLKILKENKVWIEITNLIVPTLNDDMTKIRQMCVWIKDNLGDQTPIHFARFYPQYKLENLYPTPESTLKQAHKIANDVGLKFVYIGNIPGNEAENTYCPKCNKALIKRNGYMVLENNLNSGRCKFCQNTIPGVWS